MKHLMQSFCPFPGSRLGWLAFISTDIAGVTAPPAFYQGFWGIELVPRFLLTQISLLQLWGITAQGGSELTLASGLLSGNRAYLSIHRLLA